MGHPNPEPAEPAAVTGVYPTEDDYDVSSFTLGDPKVRVRQGESWKVVTVKKSGP